MKEFFRLQALDDGAWCDVYAKPYVADEDYVCIVGVDCLGCGKCRPNLEVI